MNNSFTDYLFADGSTVGVLEVPQYHLSKKSSRPETIPHTAKARLKVNIWGAISYKGATPFVINLLYLYFFLKRVILRHLHAI